MTDKQLTMNGQTYERPEVLYHPWYTDEDGNQTYAEDVSLTEGWNVYVRWHDVRGDHWPMEVSDDEDFPHQPEACLYADALGKKYGCEVLSY